MRIFNFLLVVLVCGTSLVGYGQSQDVFVNFPQELNNRNQLKQLNEMNPTYREMQDLLNMGYSYKQAQDIMRQQRGLPPIQHLPDHPDLVKFKENMRAHNGVTSNVQH